MKLQSNSGIYKIVCLANNKFYLGSSKDLRGRFKLHIFHLKKGKHANLYLQRAFKKYGESSFKFEVIEYTNDLLNCEQYYLNLLKPFDHSIGFNICKKASGGDTISNNPRRKEICKNLSKKNKVLAKKYWNNLSNKEKEKRNDLIRGKNNGMYGKVGYWKGKKLPKEMIEKRKETKIKNGSLNCFGIDNPNYGNKWNKEQRKNASEYILKAIANGKWKTRKGQKLSVEHKEKLSNAAKLRVGNKNSFFGKKHSDEARKRISEKRIGKYYGNQNIPFQIDGVKYKSLGEASKKLGIHITTIRYRLKSSNPKFSSYIKGKEYRNGSFNDCCNE